MYRKPLHLPFFFFAASQHQSSQTHLHAPAPRFSPYTPVDFPVGPIGCWNIRRVGLVHLLSHMSRVRELEKGHVGFWTQHDPRKIGFGTKGPIMLYSIDWRMMALIGASWKVYRPTVETKLTFERLLL